MSNETADNQPPEHCSDFLHVDDQYLPVGFGEFIVRGKRTFLVGVTLQNRCFPGGQYRHHMTLGVVKNLIADLQFAVDQITDPNGIMNTNEG